MAGTIDSAVEQKLDKDPKHYAEKQRDLEDENSGRGAGKGSSDTDKMPAESPREMPKR